MTRFFKRLRGQSGASFVEYALVASLLALPVVSVMEVISEQMSAQFVALEQSVANSNNSSATTSAPGGSEETTTTTTTTTTTAAPESTTTTTTTTAAPATTTTTSTTTTTAPPPTTTTTTTTTTTAGPTTTTTAAPGPPAYQSQTITTDSGTFTFEVVDGELSLASYSLRRGWRGEVHNEDELITIELERRRGHGSEIITAWVDAEGFLQISVW